jgi:hypothetical protein
MGSVRCRPESSIARGPRNDLVNFLLPMETLGDAEAARPLLRNHVIRLSYLDAIEHRLISICARHCVGCWGIEWC